LSRLCFSIVRKLLGLPPPVAKFFRLTMPHDGTLVRIQAFLEQLGSPEGGFPRVAIGNESVGVFRCCWGKVGAQILAEC
jgi:hypothetical protein